ncbi:MAG: CPBP family intramembrane metalloprotease [Lachnospiraceae bacterium]|nr:CPBP family intramembrane metalloprotease [Lachnospiraceae bacterium]
MENNNYITEKKPGPVKKFLGGIVLSFVILGLFILLQMIVGGVMMAAAAFMAAGEMQGDTAYLMQYLYDLQTDSGFLTWLTVVATVISAVFSVFFYWLIWGRKKTQEDKQYLKEKVLKAKPVIMISVSAFGLYFVALLIAIIISVISPETMESYNQLMESALGGSQALAMLAAVILAPINEECIMRGLILKNLQKYFSVPAVIIIQAVMFGIFHMNWVQGIYVLPIGAALGYVAVKSRSVLPSIYMHLFYNLMSFVLGVLPEFCQSAVFCVAAIAVSAAAMWFLSADYRAARRKDAR